MPEKTRAFIVPHTHWDRAWYVPFEEFRIRLVRLIDGVCDTLEDNPSYTCFSLDGQTIVVEDYLQIRGEQRERIARLVQEGRLLVGPWYVLPDEFLVSPESLVRNLMLGTADAKTLGRTMQVGHGPDTFGHVAQLPQILRGFNLDNLLFGRGLDTETGKDAEFILRGPDGSTVLALHMRFWYNNAAFLGYRIGWGDTESMVWDESLALEQLKNACEQLGPHVRSGCLLLCNGVDHSSHQQELPGIVEAASSQLPGYELEIASFEDYVGAAREALRDQTLSEHDGELAYPYGDLLRGVNSSRMYLKQENESCQDLLEKWAEPCCALAWVTNSGPHASSFLRYAWRELLKNHPHDDICGCSADSVHEDMENRFARVRQVGDALTRDAVRSLARNVDVSHSKGTCFCVFNPSGTGRGEVLDVPIDLGPDEDWPAFRIHDEHGRELEYELVSQEQTGWVEVLKGIEVNRHLCRLWLHLPPLGYRTLCVTPGEPKALPNRLAASENACENEFIRMNIGKDGTLFVTDKRTGTKYGPLLVFEDMEDAGDVYNWSPLPKNPQRLTTEGGDAKVRLMRKGPLSATWQIALRMRVPEGLVASRKRRARKSVVLDIVSEVTCRAHSARIDVVTRIENTARDHRVRVLAHVPIQATQFDADAHYAVMKRGVPPAKERNGCPPYPTHHVRRFADVGDGERGLALINLGMPEFELLPGRDGAVMAQTLFRATGRLSGADLLTRPGHTGPPIDTPGAQCLRPMSFKYAFLPHEDDWRQVIHEAERHNVAHIVSRCDMTCGTDPRQLGMLKHDKYLCAQPIRPVPRTGDLAPSLSFIDIGTDALVLSAVKKCDHRDSVIVRFYNPGDTVVRAALRVFRKPAEAYACNLNEERLERLNLNGGIIEYECPAYKVMTFELVF